MSERHVATITLVLVMVLAILVLKHQKELEAVWEEIASRNGGATLEDPPVPRRAKRPPGAVREE